MMTERCPECGRPWRNYRRPINRGQAISLGRMYLVTRDMRQHGEWPSEDEMPFLHIPTVLGRRSSEEHKLVHWGLIEEENRVRPDGGRAGWWRLTIQGIEFVLGRRTVPKYAVIAPRNTLVRLEGPPWSIHDAYGEPFDLRFI